MKVVATLPCGHCGLMFRGGFNLSQRIYCPSCGRVINEPKETRKKTTKPKNTPRGKKGAT